MKDNCKHEKFQVNARVARLTDDEGSENVTGFRADIEIHCLECMRPFTFEGFPMGYSPDEPTVNFERTELRTPIKPV